MSGPEGEAKAGASGHKITMTFKNDSPETKPKKPLSAYIYFSQEFREIIR